MCDKESQVSVLAEYHLQLQLYAQAAARFRLAHPGLAVATNPAAAAVAYNFATVNGYTHPAFAENVSPYHGLPPFGRYDSRFRFINEEPKPQHSYIGLIAMAILSSPEQKMVLSDIYQYILDNYPYFRNRGHGWRNSIRHNLSLNDCFIKAGRSANGKGHYWAIHPANLEDFKKGDFRRRKAQRKVRKHMGLSVPEDEDSSSPTPTPNGTSTTLIPGHTSVNGKHLQITANIRSQQSYQSPDSSTRNSSESVQITSIPITGTANQTTPTTTATTTTTATSITSSQVTTTSIVTAATINQAQQIQQVKQKIVNLISVQQQQAAQLQSQQQQNLQNCQQQAISFTNLINGNINGKSSKSSETDDVNLLNESSLPINKAIKRNFDVESLLAPDSKIAS